MSLTVTAAVGLILAIKVPQTRAEFVDAVAAGRGATKVETVVVERDIDGVYQTLAERSAACLDVLVERSGFVGTHWEVSSSDYNPTLERIDDGTAAFALQVEHRPRGVGHKPPPGGLYVFAAEIKALDDSRTEVVLYRPTMGFKKIAASFRAWLDGDDAGCPKLR
ncbi:MAG TPA: hypothetical protein VD788_10240 [Candidatus Polarisedimenticolaceae bacterium]|nr:hypothetical protein [Candidatus Polarisedimenticolaceae bacterium]